MLCTGDKYLPLLWTDMLASNFAWTGNHVSFKLSPVEALLLNVVSAQHASFFDVAE